MKILLASLSYAKHCFMHKSSMFYCYLLYFFACSSCQRVLTTKSRNTMWDFQIIYLDGYIVLNKLIIIIAFHYPCLLQTSLQVLHWLVILGITFCSSKIIYESSYNNSILFWLALLCHYVQAFQIINCQKYMQRYDDRDMKDLRYCRKKEDNSKEV